MADQNDLYRKLLVEIMKKVPSSIGSCSVQVTREYKKDFSIAQKAFDSNRTTSAKLVSAYNKLMSYAAQD